LKDRFPDTVDILDSNLAPPKNKHMNFTTANKFPCLAVASTRRRVLPALAAGLGLILAGQAAAQSLFEADYRSGNIDEFTTNGVQSTFASGLSDPTGLAVDRAGDLFVSVNNTATSMNSRQMECKAHSPPG
jgi:hypothetical protein